jgi:hypothetical protein
MTDMLPDIQIFGVYDRGVPNLERVVLRVNRSTNLSQYMLVLGYRGHAGADTVLPIPDQSLWLGSTIIEAPSWIFIYTGSGNAGISQEKQTKEPLHSLYWNKPQVMLTHDDIVPALLHIDYVQIGNKPNLTLADTAQQKKDVEVPAFMRMLEQWLEEGNKKLEEANKNKNITSKE